MLKLVVALAACLAVVRPAPTPGLGVKFEKRFGGLPTLALPDANYRAAGYDPLADIYIFKNIRFAAPPVGDLRWAKPAPPPKNSTIQDGSYGPKCPQAGLKGTNLLGPGSSTPIGVAVNTISGQLLNPFLFSGGSEDCLFLDIFVPGSAVRSPSTTNLPVIHWFYGGGYVFGSKDQFEPALPFYDGSGLITQSGNNVIFVASNYRVGAFGFMAGKTMEQQGLPNAGLWDQRAALQWTQDNIHLVGGDPTQVTAMGESAGAGSIKHHLVARGGTLPPLFNRALLQSPAFQPMWDRKGGLEAVYKDFESLSGCSGQGLACLRALDSSTLIKANTAINNAASPGTAIFGPAPDGSFIRQLPALEFASGNYHKALDSLLVSHTSDEATVFVDGHIATDAQFSAYINTTFPAYTHPLGLPDALTTFYPPVASPNSPYADEPARTRAFVRDSGFACNARYLATAYQDRAFLMQYAVTPGWHATDLLPTFWSPDLATNPIGAAVALALPLFASFAQAYQSYLTSFVRTGDPNTYRRIWGVPWTVPWPRPSVGPQEQMGGVLRAGDLGFDVVSDDQDGKTACDFWVDVEAAATSGGGYSPPGAVVGGRFGSFAQPAASANF